MVGSGWGWRSYGRWSTLTPVWSGSRAKGSATAHASSSSCRDRYRRGRPSGSRNSPESDPGGRLGAEDADLHQQAGEVENPPLVHDQPVLEAKEEAARDVDTASGGGDAEEL